MAWQVRALSVKPDNMNSIPGTKYWEAGDQILKACIHKYSGLHSQ